MKEINRISDLTGMKPSKLLKSAGISRSTWYDWNKRKDKETKHNCSIPKKNWLTPDETDAIVKFCREYKDKYRGYRYCTAQTQLGQNRQSLLGV